MIAFVALALGLLQASPGQSRPAPAVKPATCSASLKICQDARAETDLKLQDEMERADIQNYLTRVELGATKQKLAAALAKCGAACAPPPPSAALPPPPR